MSGNYLPEAAMFIKSVKNSGFNFPARLSHRIFRYNIIAIEHDDQLFGSHICSTTENTNKWNKINEMWNRSFELVSPDLITGISKADIIRLPE